jgi:hypothetical protein
MALNFPANPAAQTPINTYSPTSSPEANTTNNLTYVYSNGVWGTTGSPPFLLSTGATMTGPLTVPTLNADEVITSSINGGPLAGLRNRIINGDFRLDQRYAGLPLVQIAGGAAYTVDRWWGYCTGANVTGQRITVAGTQTDPFRYQFTGAASVTGIGFSQRIEAQNCRDLAGKTVTLSANFSNSLLTTVNWVASYANTTDTFGSIVVPTKTQIASGSFTVNSTYSRYSTQISIPVEATTGIEIIFSVGAQTSGTWVIGQVQLEEGSVATPFEQRSLTLEELLCLRYSRWLVNSCFFYAPAAGATFAQQIMFSPPMRVVPTASGLSPDPEQAQAQSNVTVAAVQRRGRSNAEIYITAGGLGGSFSVGYRNFLSAEL